MNYKDHLFKFV